MPSPLLSNDSMETAQVQSRAAADLAELHRQSIDLAGDITLAVRRARGAGLTWEKIGAELEMGRQAVWQRWSYIDHSAEQE